MVSALNATRAFDAANGIDTHSGPVSDIASFTANAKNYQPMQTTSSMRATAATNATKLSGMIGNQASTTGSSGGNYTATNADGSTTTYVNGVPTTTPAGTGNGSGSGSGSGSGTDTGGGTADDGSGADTATTSTDGDPSDPNSIAGQVSALKSAATAKIASITTSLQGLQATADASSNALIQSTVAMFQSRITDMEQTNSADDQVTTQEGIRTGRARYAPVLQAGILSGEEQAGAQKITDLNNQMLQTVAQAEQAQNAGDLKSFNDLMDETDKINSDLNTSIVALHTAALNQQKEIDAQKTAQFTQASTTLKNNLATSKAAAPALVSQLAALTDPSAKADLIQQTATQLGVDPSVLLGEVTDAASTDEKNSLDIENIKSEMQSRADSDSRAATKAGSSSSTGGSTGGQLTVNKQGLFDTGSLTTLGAALTNGGTLGGQTYNGKGTDGYVDPGLYNSLYQSAKSKYGAAAAEQFMTKYPPKKYINPSNAGSTELDPAISAALGVAS